MVGQGASSRTEIPRSLKPIVAIFTECHREAASLTVGGRNWRRGTKSDGSCPGRSAKNIQTSGGCRMKVASLLSSGEERRALILATLKVTV